MNRNRQFVRRRARFQHIFPSNNVCVTYYVQLCHLLLMYMYGVSSLSLCHARAHPPKNKTHENPLVYFQYRQNPANDERTQECAWAGLRTIFVTFVSASRQPPKKNMTHHITTYKRNYCARSDCGFLVLYCYLMILLNIQHSTKQSKCIDYVLVWPRHHAHFSNLPQKSYRIPPRFFVDTIRLRSQFRSTHLSSVALWILSSVDLPYRCVRFALTQICPPHFPIAIMVCVFFTQIFY